MKRFSMAMTWLAVAGLMTTVSCRKPVVGFTNGEARTVTVSAVTESGDGSKTSIDGLYVKWSEDDEISMNGCKLTLEEGAGGTMGRFTGEVTDDGPYLIGYPFGNTKYDNGTLKLSIRDSWTYADMKEIVPMAAYAEKVGDDVQFRNAVNMLKLQLKGVGDDDNANKLKRIVLTSATSNLSGDISVEFDGEGNPTFNAITDGTKTMTVSFGEEGLQLKADEVKCVYIPLAKIAAAGDLTVRFVCANGGYMEKKVTADANFDAVNNMLSAELPVNATLKEHGYVDLGLPSGLKWATCNVGADSPEGSGWYFMWGSVTEGGDPNCSWANCPGNDGSGSYNSTAFSTWKDANLTDDVLKPGVDAATANWGGGWRMPTTGEWKELYDNTTSTWTTENGVYGRKFTSTKEGYTGRYIFLPPAGYRFGTSLNFAGSRGYYWSSSHGSSGPSDGEVGMYFLSGNVDPQLISYRCYGFPVRPVR